MLAVLRLTLLGLHCAFASALGLLITLCRPFHPDNSRICAKLFAWPALRIMGFRMDIHIESLLELKRPCVIIANHQSNHDLFVVGGLIPPRTVSMGKKSLKWLPLFGQLYWLAGNVLIDRGNARSAKRALLATSKILRERNTSIFVFPEGTRNDGEDMLPFKKGAFQLAIAAGVPVVPLCVNRYARNLDANRWVSARIGIRSLEPIETCGMQNADLARLMEDCRSRMSAGIAELDALVKNPAPVLATPPETTLR